MKAVLSIWAVLGLAHAVLAHVLSDGGVVSSMLSAGAHTPLHFVALSGGFYAIRLLVLVVLPVVVVGLGAHSIARSAITSRTRLSSRK